MPTSDSRPVYVAKAELMRTLGHPVRIRLLELLSVRERAVHELLAEVNVDLPIEASNLSHQLAVLRRVGLVQHSRRDGEVRYRVAVREVPRLLASARALLESVASERAALRRALDDAGSA